jgi:membrane protease subunit (stomatin/prohibitin family)
MGQVIGQSLNSTLTPQAVPASPQPAAAAAGSAAAEDGIEARLEKLKGLLDKGLISAADYDSSKAELLKKLIG